MSTVSTAATTSALQSVEGNHACALAAIAAGCRFYAGYPITPSSEVAEKMSVELPKVGGTFIQMEDEIASMGAVLGASMGGVKALTATSGPGFSLKQENLGYASMAEIPCVIVNVMRGGPSTGLPTRPSQGDVMQARWGSHGDHPVIVLTPASVDEIYTETVRAFNLSELLRVPVVLLYDEVIGHLVETIELREPADLELFERRWTRAPPEEYVPFAAADDGVPEMARPGDGYRTHITGLTHGENGFPTQNPEQVDRVMRRLLGKLDRNQSLVEHFEALTCEDADIIIVAYGITSRAARRAVKLGREQGIGVGLFRPITLWPFPQQAFVEIVDSAGKILVPELNAGQLCLEIERLCSPSSKVSRMNRIDGLAITPNEILERVKALESND
ncbi:MAG: 2-oxoacid:acceptor oxidoreductase subunit alpha [Gammaproteobacteria bacterium]|nr:2-oxoacid:acceptor oxidoreductase subunit alpha [Gammaproteobacteria bacterium]MDH3464731.1 2-oxoacid:acceptor oxidoreductase subunit alpha [Gammaproteobacteria bacterium]